MKNKTTLLLACLFLCMNFGYNQCTITGGASFSSSTGCAGGSVTVSGYAWVAGGLYGPCPANLDVQLQKYDAATSSWINMGPSIMSIGSISSIPPISIPSSYGSGLYRLYVYYTGSPSYCGCGSVSSNAFPSGGYSITFYNNPTADAGPDFTVCPGDCVTLGVGGRIALGTTYAWNPSGLPVSGYPKKTYVCPSVTTTYTTTVTDANGCTATDVATVTIQDGSWCHPEFQVPGGNKGQNTVVKKGETDPRNFTVTVYPNPSTGKFTIEINDEISGTIRVYNSLGMQIISMNKESGNNRYEIDLTPYSAGMYTVQMESNGTMIVKKLLVQ